MNQLLVDIASAVLTHFKGSGSWVRWDEVTPAVRIPEDPLLGLNVGDTVFFLNEDDSRIDTETVAVVNSNGVAFYCRERTADASVILYPIASSDFAASMEDFVNNHRDDLDRELEYLRSRRDELERLESQISEFQ